MRSQTVQLRDLFKKNKGTIDPSKFADECFELFSIPAYEQQSPEITQGISIGSTKQLVDEGDILLSKIVPHIRRAWVVSGHSSYRKIASGEWIVFNDPRIHPPYFRHYLLSNLFHRQFMTTVSGVGGSLLRAKPSLVGNFDIALPPLAEQRRIAAILDKAEEIKRKRETAIAKLDQLAQSVFVEMFGDPVTNPKRWNLCRLEEIANVGSSKRVFVDELTETGVPFFRGTEIGQLGEGIAVRPSLFVSNEHFLRLKTESGIPTKGDLLLPSICPDGRIFIVKDDQPFYFKDGRVLWISLNKSLMNSYFLRQQLKNIFFVNYSKIASGTTFSELKIFALKTLSILLPPFELQEQFAKNIEKIQEQRDILRDQLQNNQQLINSLQHQAFTTGFDS